LFPQPHRAMLEAQGALMNKSLKYANGLELFKDLIENRITFAFFSDRFRELPKAEQDRLLASNLKPAIAKVASA
jgi:hypothetical protein